MNFFKVFISFLFISFFLSIKILGQINTDSLELLLEFENNKEDKIEILLNLSGEFKNNNPEKALGFAQNAYKLSKETKKQELLLNAMLNLAEIYCSLSDFKSAMGFAYKSKELAEETNKKKEIAKSLQLIGLIYSDLGDFEESSNFYFRSLNIYEEIKDKNGIGKSFSRIASVYYDQKNYDKALDYYFKSLNIAKEIDDKEGIAGGLNDIAAVYGNRKQYDKVDKYLKEAVVLNNELGNMRAVAINYTNLGLINQFLKNYNKALDYYNKALSIFKDLNHIVLIANCEVALSGYYLETDNPDLSIDYAKKAYEAGTNHGLKKVIYDAAGMLYNCYLKKNDSILADKYLILQYKMKDSLDIEKSSTQLSKLEIRYEFEKENQAKKIEQQRKDFIVIIIIVSLILGLGIIILIFARQKIKSKNTELEKIQLEKELEFKNKELALKVMSLLKKNEMLSEISEKLIKIRNEAVKEETKIAVKRLYNDLQKSTEDKIWEEFELRFKQVHSKFYEKLMNKYPELSPNEQKLCAFLRLNMSSKEISELTGQSINALETARYRLRKKLGISNSPINLITFLTNI